LSTLVRGCCPPAARGHGVDGREARASHWVFRPKSVQIFGPDLLTSPVVSCDLPWPTICWYQMVSNYNHPLRHPDRPWASSIRLGTALRCFFGRRPRRSTEALDGLLCVRTACPHARAHSACSMRCHTAFSSRGSTVYDRTSAYRLLFPAQTSGLSPG
jgi:hypothetical protein